MGFPLPASRFPLPASRFPLPASRVGDHHGMDVTTALEKPEDGDFSGGAPAYFAWQ